MKRVVAKSGKEKKAPTDLTHTPKKKTVGSYTLFLPPPPPLTKPEDSLCYFGIAFCKYCTKS